MAHSRPIALATRFKRFFPRSLIGSLAASGLIQLSLIVSGVIVARMFDPTLRGQLGLILTLPLVAGQLVTLGIPSATTYFAAQSGDWRRAWAPVRTIGIGQAVSGVLLVLLLDLAFLSGRGGANWRAALVVLPSGAVVVALAYAIHLAQGLNQSRAFSALRTLPTCIYALALVAAWFMRANLAIVALLWTTSQVGAVVVLIGWLSRQQPKAGPPDRRRDVVHYGVVGFLAQVSPVESFRVDQLFVAVALSPRDLGLYIVAAGVANPPRFVADAVSAIAFPVVAAHRHDPAKGRELQAKYTTQCVLVATATAAVLIASFPYLIPSVFGSRYAGAVPVAEVLVVSSVAIGIRRVLSDCMRALGFVSIPTIGELVSWIVLLVGLLVFGARVGATAVAASMIAAALAGTATQIWLLKRRTVGSAPVQRSPDAPLPLPE